MTQMSQRTATPDRGAEAKSSNRHYAQIELGKLSEYEKRILSWPIDVRGSRILDLGAGPGQWGLLLMQLGAAALTWHDRSADFEDFARELYKSRGVSAAFVRADIMDIGRYENDSFDLVFSRGALHYSHNEWQLLRDVSRIARKWIYIEAPSWRWSWRGPEGLTWKTPLFALSGMAAMVTRRKLQPTRWQSRRFVCWRLRREGFVPVWERYGPARQSWWTLFERCPDLATASTAANLQTPPAKIPRSLN